jgi:HEAT repeat protein
MAMDASCDSRIRALCCSILGAGGTPDVVQPLIDIVKKSEDPLVAWEALAAIGSARSRRATRFLMGLIATAKEPVKTQGAIFALGLLRDERASETLVRILRNVEMETRSRSLAAEALGFFRPRPRVLGVLVDALRDPDPEVRYSSLCGLGAQRQRRTIPYVKRLLDDDAALGEGESVAKCARLVLDAIQGRR